MPILKIPVLHKFGIISHRQRLELQQRLLTQNKDAKVGSTTASGPQKNPLGVSEEFVQQYNAAALEEKQKLHEMAEKMLLRSKRRCGLSTNGEGNHVDLSLGWSELAVLAQCKGKLREDCFRVLCVSLNHAPLNEDNIPTLFFLAESALYWLQTDAVKQDYLRLPEIKLVKLGELVFTRLLFHHLSGHLRGLPEYKQRLYTYMEGVRSHEQLYKAYPGVLVSLHLIRKAGEVVVGPYSKSNVNKEEEERMAESVPALAACVYRALCVWQSVGKIKTELKKSIIAMFLAAHELCSKNWIDGFVAISLIGEAAKRNAIVCKALQDLGRGVRVTLTRGEMGETTVNHFPSAPSTGAADVRSPLRHARQIESEFQAEIDTMLRDFDSAMQRDARQLRKDSSQARLSSRPQPMTSTRGSLQPSAHPQIDTPSDTAFSPAPNPPGDVTYGIGGWGWQVGYQYVAILSELCLRGSSTEVQKMALLGKWQDADVTTFRAGMPNPCTESCALVDLIEYRGPPPAISTRDLHTHLQKTAWTWRIRYAALFGLCSLTHTLHGDSMRDGMRSAAFSLITAIQESSGAEQRVTEAVSVAQIESSDLRSADIKLGDVSLWSRIAQALCDIYLVPAQPVLSRSPRSVTKPTPSPQHLRAPPQQQQAPTTTSPRRFPINITRPTIRQELLIRSAANGPARPPDAAQRNSLDLQRIVMDRWRKELLQEQTAEERSRLIELQTAREEEEKQEQEVIVNRRRKLKGRATVNLCPYDVAACPSPLAMPQKRSEMRLVAKSATPMSKMITN